MKKTLSIVVVITFISTLIGCSDITKNVSIKSASPISTQISEKKKYTEEDAIATFKENKDLNNYKIIDYVLIEDDKTPMLKAVISFYDKKKSNSCNLAFIYGESSQEICFAANEGEEVKNFEIADNTLLKYVGDGAVTTSIRKISTSEVIDYKVKFSYNKSNSITNFKIISQKAT